MTWARIMLNAITRQGAVLGLVLLWATAAHAQLEIEITRGMSNRTPVAVVPFGWQGSAAEAPFDVSAVVSADLYRSGRFAPVAAEKGNCVFGDLAQRCCRGEMVSHVVLTGMGQRVELIERARSAKRR